jgi:hypothetical protein
MYETPWKETVNKNSKWYTDKIVQSNGAFRSLVFILYGGDAIKVKLYIKHCAYETYGGVKV